MLHFPSLDVEPPTFVQVSSFSITLEVGFAVAVLVLPSVTVVDNSGEMVTVTTSPANNSQVDIGRHVVTFTITDAFGIFVSFSISVTVIGKSYL